MDAGNDKLINFQEWSDGLFKDGIKSQFDDISKLISDALTTTKE